MRRQTNMYVTRETIGIPKYHKRRQKFPEGRSMMNSKQINFRGVRFLVRAKSSNFINLKFIQGWLSKDKALVIDDLVKLFHAVEFGQLPPTAMPHFQQHFLGGTPPTTLPIFLDLSPPH
jgi:hypothetical protein